MGCPGATVGRTLGHYRIVEQIGAGGMGVVYRAHDERLDRDVALKVLPPGTLADDCVRKRFRREALALSQLNHPNIATVHDFDTEEGTDFLVTELVPGMTLDEKLAGGPLPEKEVLHLGLQLAEGLEAAHRQGVIHRDLKPANLRLTSEGRLKILDFGLAKRVDPADQESLTQSAADRGGPAGTLAYMAPEQLRSERVDARSDIWAAGVVLYELSTGKRPFEGATTTVLGDEILHASPPSPQLLRPRLSSRLADMIQKCLEKNPENRYQSARDLLVDFRRLSAPTAAVTALSAVTPKTQRWKIYAAGAAVLVVLVAALLALRLGYRGRASSGGTTAGIHSLAVLPLANLSKDPEQQFFVEGMQDELITRLSKLKDVKVISRMSTLQYRDNPKPAPEVGRELGVEGLIEGSVRRSGNQVAITVQLIRAATDEHVWAESYQRDVTDVLALQADMAQGIARTIGTVLNSGGNTTPAPRKVIPEAYEAYLRGRQAMFSATTPAGTLQAKTWFEKAIALDPTFALAYAYLGRTYVRLGIANQVRRHDAYTEAEELQEKAVELENTPEVRLFLVTTRANTRNSWDEITKVIDEVLAVNPNDLLAHGLLAQIFSFYGRHDEAVAEQRKVMELDPSCRPGCELFLASVYRWARRYNEALPLAQSLTKQYPNDPYDWMLLAFVRLETGATKEAVQAAETAAKLAPSDPHVKDNLAYFYAKVGRTAEARRILREQESALAAGRPASPVDIGYIHLALGEREQFFPWLERGFDDYDPNLFQLQDPVFDPVRDDPRFQWAMKRRAGKVQGPYPPAK